MEGTPSDESPAVLGHGGTDVRIAVVSMSTRSREGADAAYLEWHLLDHLPEQHRIAGLRNGTRWVATPACRAARLVAEPPYDEVDHVVCYLFAEPVDAGLETFFALGADLREAGRMPMRLPAVELGGYRLRHRAASRSARTGGDVLPWRPARGVLLILEQGAHRPGDELLEVDGVAGLWSFEGDPSLHDRLAANDGKHLTIVYLDDDPAAVASRLAEPLRARWADGAVAPLLVSPLAAVRPFEWAAVLPT